LRKTLHRRTRLAGRATASRASTPDRRPGTPARDTRAARRSASCRRARRPDSRAGCPARRPRPPGRAARRSATATQRATGRSPSHGAMRFPRALAFSCSGPRWSAAAALVIVGHVRSHLLLETPSVAVLCVDHDAPAAAIEEEVCDHYCVNFVEAGEFGLGAG